MVQVFNQRNMQKYQEFPKNSNYRYSSEYPENNDIQLCIPKEYDFAIGLHEIEAIEKKSI